MTAKQAITKLNPIRITEIAYKNLNDTVIVQRYKSETPSKWKGIFNTALSVAVVAGTICGGALATAATVGVALPAWIAATLGAIAMVGGGVAAYTGQKTNNKELTKQSPFKSVSKLKTIKNKGE